MDSKDYTPLVSDQDVKRIRNAKFSETVPIFEVRDLYEARYKEDAATIAALREEVEALKVAGDAMRYFINEHIIRIPKALPPLRSEESLITSAKGWDALTTKTD